MKKTILLLAAIAIAGVYSVQAQGGGFQRRTVEERVKAAMDKLADFKLDKAKWDQTDSAFTNYYRSRDKAIQDMMAGPERPDRDKMREATQKLDAERDDKLKTIFTADQFKKWKDEIEPTLRPQRRGPGGAGNGGAGGGNSGGNK